MNQKTVRTLLRVSSKQQLHDDDIPTQRAECQKFISLHPEWGFDHEYIERAVSGYKKSVKDRDILLEILEDAKNKKFDILVVFMSDRIGRKEDESPAYVANLNKLGTEVYSVNEGQLKTEEHIDKLMNYIRFWQAEGESRKTGLRVKSAQKEMVKQGKFVGGKAPYGYELIFSGNLSNHGRALKKLQIAESHAAIVREIYRLAAEEELGSFAIAKHLNIEKIPSVNNGEWKSCTISDMLKNPIYMGYLAYNRRELNGTYSRNQPEDWIYSNNQIEDLVIIPSETWHKTQKKRAQRKSCISQTKESYPITTSGQLVLMGLVYCGYCGTRLTNGSRYDSWNLKDGTRVKKMCGRYRCTQKANASLLCTGQTFYRQDEIEPIVLEVVNKYMSNLKQSGVYQEILSKQEEGRKVIQKELDSICKELDSIQTDIITLESQIPQALRGDGLFSAEKLTKVLQSKELQKSVVQQRLHEKHQEYESTVVTGKDLSRYSRLSPNWKQEFTEADTHLKKVLLSKIIERIEVKKEEIKIIFKIHEEDFHPCPLEQFPSLY